MHFHKYLYDGWRHGYASLGELRVEWSVFRRQSSLGISFELNCEREANASISVPGCSLYFRIGSRLFPSRLEERSFKLQWHDGGLWLSPWQRSMEWRRSDPWWIRGVTFCPLDFVFGKDHHENVVLETREVEIPMPEGVYKATATKERSTWKRPRAWWKRERIGWDLAVEGGIPSPGKWGEDGIWATGHDGHDVETAIGHYVAAVLKMRVRHGRGHRDTGKKVA